MSTVFIFIFSITAHSINANFELDFDLLACVPMINGGKGDNIADYIKDTCSLLEIPLTKIVALVRDGAQQMISAANLLGIVSINCFIHKLQLCVKESTGPFEDEIKKARDVSRRFNNSSHFHNDFCARSNKHLIRVRIC